MDYPEAYVVAGCRSAIGLLHSHLSNFPAPQLGALAIKEVVKRAGIDPATIDEVIMGQVVQGGVGQAPARQAAIHGGIPPEVPALTINKVCGSGLKAVMMAASQIKAGDGHCFVCGGMESMSNTPLVLSAAAKRGVKFGHQKLMDIMISDGLWDSFNNHHMGNAAEYTADKAGITREMQDEFAYNSHQKALKAQEEGKFDEEIFPIEIPQRKGDPVIFKKDEGPRNTPLEKFTKLRPAFVKDGTVTAGNAPGLNDGSAAVVVCSKEYIDKHGLKPIAKITAYDSASLDPKDLFFTPIYAVRKIMKKLNVDINYFDLFEANEAFSAQALADGKELGWDWDRVNVHGGAVALGHPIGASGARVLVTLMNALKDRGKKNGLATLCLGGGSAVALSIEMV
ncbi:MAG: acetyl-CoA C-acyltransferase [candidate division Zixibacteria bacterium]|nr:acetyl-CoA C-acyltransferase [candidate division Zixibacteria bacterium]